MIGKLKKGASFGGCIRYVTGKDEAKILASDGVLLGTNAEIVQSFELQRQLNPRIKKPWDTLHSVSSPRISHV